MAFLRLTAQALVLALVTTCLAADVTITAHIETRGMGQTGKGESVTLIKGMQSRTETTLGGNENIVLLDLDDRQMTTLYPDKKRAETFDLTPIAQQQVRIETQDVSLEPSGTSRQVAGYSCDDHALKAKIEGGMPGMSVLVVMSGTVCISKQAPGGGEYAAFYQAMAERGLFSGNPEAAQAQPGRERGLTELYRKMSEKGVALVSDLEIGFEGDGPVAAMLGRMKIETSTTVTAISVEPVAEDALGIPSGYKVKKR